MKQYAADLEFEDAARLRDEIRRLEANELGIGRHLRARGRRPLVAPAPAHIRVKAAKRCIDSETA